ncbi:MAG: protealysin inhibitor emfourin [Actinomycetes bacterium]
MSVVRTGGFAGVEQPLGVVDTADLPPEDADEVARALRQVAAAPPEVGADLLAYRVTVADDAGERTFVVPDPQALDPESTEVGAAPSSLEVLLRHLGPG